MLLGRLRRPEVSPRCKRLDSGLPSLLGACIWSFLPPSGSGCGCFRCPSCSFHPAPAWFPRRPALRMVAVALALDSERTFAFGRSFCSVSGSAPSSLVVGWCGSLGACLPFVPCLFLWSRCHSGVNGRGAGVVLPIGLFPLSAFGVGLPPLWRWQTREAESCGPIRSSGRLPGACSSLSSSPLTLPGVVMTFPVCLPRAPALRQVLVAMLAEGT